MSAAARFRVHVAKEQFGFCAGHFISYAGNQCERLHGHNYRVAVTVEGPLDANFYVFDFIALKDLTKTITDELDHRLMLPRHNAFIRVAEQGEQVEVTYGPRRWSFPAGDCVLLPIENTTAELLARYLATRLRDGLATLFHFRPTLLRVEVEESPGQAAAYEETGTPGSV